MAPIRFAHIGGQRRGDPSPSVARTRTGTAADRGRDLCADRATDGAIAAHLAGRTPPARDLARLRLSSETIPRQMPDCGPAQVVGRSAAIRVVSCSSVGSSASTRREAWFDTASSNRLRTKRALPKLRSRGVGREDRPQSLDRALARHVPVGLAHLAEDLHQLVVGVVGEDDGVGEARSQPGVAGHERRHLVGVPSGDHRQVVAVVLHELHQGVDGLLPEVALAAAGQRVGLVDEQQATERLLDDRPRLHGGLADVAGHQQRAVRLDQLALREHAERLVDPRQQAGHGRLAGARGCR